MISTKLQVTVNQQSLHGRCILSIAANAHFKGRLLSQALQLTFLWRWTHFQHRVHCSKATHSNTCTENSSNRNDGSSQEYQWNFHDLENDGHNFS
eukprot:6734-Heterococcus_DN1.PRE.2